MVMRNLLQMRRENDPLYHMIMAFIAWFGAFGLGAMIPSTPFQRIIIASCFSVVEDPVAKAAAKQAAAGSTAAPAAPEVASSKKAPGKEEAPPRVLQGYEWLLLPAIMLTFVLTYPPTNLILLCCLGAVIGSQAVSVVCPAEERVRAMSAMVHGLCIYLGMVAGLIVIQGDFTFDTDKPDLYLRISAAATLFALLAGTNKSFLRDLARAFSPFRLGPASEPPAPGMNPPPALAPKPA